MTPAIRDRTRRSAAASPPRTLPWRPGTLSVVASPLAVLLAVGALLLYGLMSPPAVHANGDAVEVFRGRGGPYEVVVAVLPPRPDVGVVHFSLTILEAASSQSVRDAEVVLVARSPEDDRAIQVRALNNRATPDRYEANMSFATPGTWLVAVEVSSDRLGAATVEVPLEVGGESISPDRGASIVFAALLVVLVGGGMYVWYSARRSRRSGAR